MLASSPLKLQKLWMKVFDQSEREGGRERKNGFYETSDTNTTFHLKKKSYDLSSTNGEKIVIKLTRFCLATILVSTKKTK